MVVTVTPIFCRAICGVRERFLVVIFVGGHGEEGDVGMVDCSGRENSTLREGDLSSRSARTGCLCLSGVPRNE